MILWLAPRQIIGLETEMTAFRTIAKHLLTSNTFYQESDRIRGDRRDQFL